MMRTFEILILITLFGSLVGYSLPAIRHSRWINLLPTLTVLFIILNLVVEKYRWQMMPAYALALLFILLSVRRIRAGERQPDKHPPRRVLNFSIFLFSLLIFCLVAALPILLPVFRLPDPSGPFPVGTTKVYFVDEMRPETFTPNPDDRRELMIQAWYPASVEPGAKLAPLMEDMPFQLSHLSLVQTHAYQDAPVSDAQSTFPVLIFSHGHVGFLEQNLTQMEELASHGYIVWSLAHPYHTIQTVFPDGRVIPADPVLANNFLKGISPTPAVSAEHLRIWNEDTRFLMDELERIQSGEVDSLFAGKLDITRLGIFGQSFGGMSAVQVCSVDDRCKAGVSLDAGLPGGVVSPLKQPFLFMLNESATYFLNTNLPVVDSAAYRVQVHGSTHFDFTDLSFYSPVLKYTKAFGRIEGERMVKIINGYMLAFFDEYLKGEKSPLLDGPSPDYPEVTIKIRNP